MFVPKHKRIDNLLTAGEPLVDKVSGVPYFGPYFETSNGKKYTGTSPLEGTPRELEDSPEDTILPETNITLRNNKNAYDVLRNDPEAFKLKITGPLPVHFPTNIPAGASFMRYFAKDIRTEKIVEINQNTYKELVSRSAKYYYPNFTTTQLLWVIEGPLQDTNTGSYTVPGIASQNKSATERANKVMSGLSGYITDYTQFAR